ncbi:MAG TPA: M48 family metalloprotease [Burkholderiaceae bacterium]
MHRIFQSRTAVALATSLLSLSTPLSYAQVNLPALGDSVSDEVGIGAERRIGDQVMRQIRPDPDYLDDPLLLEYVEGIWQPLVVAAKRMGNIGEDTQDRFAWEPFLVRDKSVNAFALPGGFVGVHLGLIAMTASSDELASVLGHELSHITQRHLARRMVGDSKSGMLATVGMILGILAAAKSRSPDGVNAAIIGSQAAAVQAQLNFSRDMEREADRVGFNVMTAAGFAPSGMYSMFERMEQSNHLNDAGAYPYLRSHPLTSERIGDARARLGTGNYERPRSLPEHMLMAARARVLADPRAEFWAQLQGLDSGARNVDGRSYEQLAARYTSALASIRMRDYDRAEAALRGAYLEMTRLGGDAHAVRYLHYAALELAVARERPQAGLAVLAALRAMGEPANSRPLVLAQTALALVDPDVSMQRAAADSLQTYLSNHGHDALAWSQQALLWTRLGQPLRSLRAQGEARAAIGDINGAIDRLRSGVRLAKGPQADAIELAVIDARLRSLLYERRQMLAELYPRGAPPNAELPQ